VRVSESYLLFIPVVPLSIWYARSFYKLISGLDEQERTRFNKSGRPLWNILGTVVPLVLVLTSPAEVRFFGCLLSVSFLVFATRAHHRRLREVGFGPVFLKRLMAVTRLSAIGHVFTLLALALR
jgi:hypothetical protein